MLTTKKIFQTWWPLAASWMLMGAELPAVSAVAARLADPKIHLAAYSGIVFPLILLIESPIIMLLAASTALCKDQAAYQKMYRFMMITSALLTGIHAVVAFTPLYGPVARGLLGAPEEIIEPGRVGLMIMLPWTWTIAYRRFHQGVLIRFGLSRTVGVGTAVRLAAVLAALSIGYALNWPGIVAITVAVASGVTSEAIYAWVVSRPVVRGPLRAAPPADPPLTMKSFASFYIPLVLMAFIQLLATPVVSAALSRMPQALESLAVWSPLSGLVFMMRGLGTAYNEVVVALLDEREAHPRLKAFANGLMGFSTLVLLAFVATPLAGFWFSQAAALPADLSRLAVGGMWLALPLPAMTVLQSWFQGHLLHGRRTNGISQAVVVYFIVSSITLGGGVLWGQMTGLFVGMISMLLSNLAQTGWLWRRGRMIASSPIRTESV
jgi:hypothetical protein